MIVVLGTLAITSEYSTGMIRTSLTVMPRRGVFYGAKAAVFAAVALVVALLTSFAAFFIGQALLASTHVSATLSQPNVLRAVLGTALYIVLCGLFAFGLGAILRSTAGAMTAAYGLLFLLPQLAKALPSAWYADVDRWLPGGDVINAITSTQSANAQPAPVLRVGRVRGVRRLHGHRARHRRAAVPPPRRLTQHRPTSQGEVMMSPETTCAGIRLAALPRALLAAGCASAAAPAVRRRRGGTSTPGHRRPAARLALKPRPLVAGANSGYSDSDGPDFRAVVDRSDRRLRRRPCVSTRTARSESPAS